MTTATKSQRIYVASSWRNNFQQLIVHTLRAAKFEVYDFKNPHGNKGFSFHEVGLDGDKSIVGAAYVNALKHTRAEEGFTADFDAMKWADTFVLVLPCGKSAHLELGWAVGAGKRTAILLEEVVQPELMYKMVDHIATDPIDLLGWLGVED